MYLRMFVAIVSIAALSACSVHRNSNGDVVGIGINTAVLMGRADEPETPSRRTIARATPTRSAPTRSTYRPSGDDTLPEFRAPREPTAGTREAARRVEPIDDATIRDAQRNVPPEQVAAAELAITKRVNEAQRAESAAPEAPPAGGKELHEQASTPVAVREEKKDVALPQW